MATCRKCVRELPEGAAFCPWCGARQEMMRSKHRRANGMGTVYLDGGSWCAERTKGYKLVAKGEKIIKHRVSERKWGFKTKRDAEAYLRQILAGVGAKKAQTLQELYATYSTTEMLKKGSSTRSAYRIAWKRIEPISFTAISLLAIDDLQALVAGLTYDPAKDIKDLLSILFKRAIAQGYVTVNLSEYISLPEHMAQETERFSSDEVTNIWRAYGAGDMFAGYILLMVYTGMMPAELMKCKKSMVDWENQRIIGCGAKTKRRKEMPIVFPDFIAPVLAALCDYSKSRIGNILCMNKDSFYTEFKAFRNRCGLRDTVTPYSSRRSTGTELALKGVPPAVIVDAMRQKDYQTTMSHYTLLDTSDILDALNKLDHPQA